MNGLPKLKRRWYQFSLRSLLVLVLLVSIGMSWLAVRKQRVRRQRQAVEAIRESGGQVDYLSAETAVPPWLSDSLGNELFSLEVICVRLRETEATDACLEHVNGFTDLLMLDLAGTQVTDAGLEHLNGLNNLLVLDLSATRVTGVGLEHIRELARLHQLDLSDTQVTDVGLEHLKGLASLRFLDLDNTQVTDAGLEHLKRLTQLRALSLKDTHLSAAGANELGKALPDCRIHH